MPLATVIRAAREEDLSVVLRLWEEAEVTPPSVTDSIEGLTRFTMTIIDLATGKPHAPMKTVVRTYKADGALDNTQVTTTEIDWDALEQLKKQPRHPERQRQYVAPPLVNPGLFFVPR